MPQLLDAQPTASIPPYAQAPQERTEPAPENATVTDRGLKIAALVFDALALLGATWGLISNLTASVDPLTNAIMNAFIPIGLLPILSVISLVIQIVITLFGIRMMNGKQNASIPMGLITLFFGNLISGILLLVCKK